VGLDITIRPSVSDINLSFDGANSSVSRKKDGLEQFRLPLLKIGNPDFISSPQKGLKEAIKIGGLDHS
jgi:hypothetical protein